MTTGRQLEHIAQVEAISNCIALGRTATRIGKLNPQPSPEFTQARKAFYAAAKVPAARPRRKAKAK